MEGVIRWKLWCVQSKAPPSPLVNTKQPSDLPVSYAICFTDCPPPPLPTPTSPWERQVIIAFEQAKYMRKPYALVSGITKKCLQLSDGVKICIFVPVCYHSFNASHIHELKTIKCNIQCCFLIVNHYCTLPAESAI